MKNQFMPGQETLDFVMKRLSQALISPLSCPKCNHEFNWDDGLSLTSKAQEMSARDFLMMLLSASDEPTTVLTVYQVAKEEGYSSSAIRKARTRVNDRIENFVYGGKRCWRIKPQLWQEEHNKWYPEKEND